MTSEQFYRKCPEKAFLEGYVSSYGWKRIEDTHYLKYHYYMPARMSSVVRHLQKYFESIRRTTLEADPVQRPSTQIRRSKWDFADTAIKTFMQIRRRIRRNDPIIAGSQEISPCPWAIFGKLTDERLAKHVFEDMESILSYYTRFLLSKGFNTVKVYHSSKRDAGRIRIISKTFSESTNVVLAVALLLLYDIIRNCGPDSCEFLDLWTNEKYHRYGDAFHIWRAARNNLSPPDLKLHAAIHARFPVRSGYLEGSNYSKRDSYADVGFTDISSKYLECGEEFVLFEEFFKRVDDEWEKLDGMPQMQL